MIYCFGSCAVSGKNWKHTIHSTEGFVFYLETAMTLSIMSILLILSEMKNYGIK